MEEEEEKEEEQKRRRRRRRTRGEAEAKLHTIQTPDQTPLASSSISYYIFIYYFTMS